MAVRVSIEPEVTLPKRQRDQVVEDIHLFVELLNRLPRGDARKLRDELARVVVLDEVHPSRSGDRHPVTGEPVASPAEQAQLGFRSLVQFFEARRQLLDDALTAPQVAEVLGVSRQTPLNRVKENTLLAILDRGAYRFPAWQFDSQGEDGVLAGLPDVLEALQPQQPFAKLVWLRRENPALDRREPVELLRRHEVAPVIAAARAAANLP
jgi:hypothetical protein